MCLFGLHTCSFDRLRVCLIACLLGRWLACINIPSFVWLVVRLVFFVRLIDCLCVCVVACLLVCIICIGNLGLFVRECLSVCFHVCSFVCLCVFVCLIDCLLDGLLA